MQTDRQSQRLRLRQTERQKQRDRWGRGGERDEQEGKMLALIILFLKRSPQNKHATQFLKQKKNTLRRRSSQLFWFHFSSSSLSEQNNSINKMKKADYNPTLLLTAHTYHKPPEGEIKDSYIEGYFLSSLTCFLPSSLYINNK